MLLFLQTCCHTASSSRRALLPLLLSLSRPGALSVDNASAVAKDQLAGSSGHYLQQHRGLAAKAKKATAKKDVKKGQQKPGKKAKQKLDLKGFDEKDQFLQKLVTMLVPAQEPLRRNEEQQQEAVLAAKEYRRRHNQRHKAWSADMRVKLALKLAALNALPPDLRQAAREEDLTPFPLTRHFLYDSPPDAYKQ